LHHHIHLKLFISTMFFYRHITSLLPEIVMPHDCSYYCFLKKKFHVIFWKFWNAMEKMLV